MPPAVPLLYLLAVILWTAVTIALPDFRVDPAIFLLAPVLYLAGGQIRDSLGDFEVRDAAAPIAQVVLGTFLIGGLVHILDPRTGSGGAAGGIAMSLLLGLALSLSEPSCACRIVPRRLPRDRSSRPESILAEQSLLMLLLGAPAASVLGMFIDPGSGRAGVGRESMLALLALSKGLAAGAGVGLAGWAVLRATRKRLPRSIVHLLLAEASVIAVFAVGSGAALLAALAAGFLGRGSAPAADRSGERGDAEAFPGASLVLFIGGAGIFIVAADRLGPSAIAAAAPAGALLWIGSVVLRILVHFGFGGLRRLGRPAEIPARWLPAIAWASYPGPAALGLYLAAEVAAGAAPAGEPLTAQREAALAVAVLLALLVQGVTAGAGLARAARGPSTGGARERWMGLIARGIALRAERREVDELRVRGWIDPSAVAAMEDAIRDAERRLTFEEEETLAGEPRLLAEELTRATRRVLEAGRLAVAEARESGRVDEPAAREVEESLARLGLRTGSAPLADLLGGAAGRREPEGDGDRPPPEGT